MPLAKRSQTARRRARSTGQYSPRQRESVIQSRKFYEDSNQDQTLCGECQTFDLDSLFKERLTQEGVFPLDAILIRPIKWSVDSCPLCMLLDRTFGIKKKLRHRKLVDLWLYPSKGFRNTSWPLIETGLISVNAGFADTSVCLVPQPDGILVVRKLKPLTSFSLLRDWLGFCRQYHTSACSARKQDATSLALIPSFKLLDCRTGELISGNVEPYAALSYVWGVGKRITNHSPSGKWDLRELPGTIRDAVKATKRLGLRYLWVDQLCINQLDERELHEQTSKMDLIYSNAEVTIIAAAGTDFHHGLPGVRSRKLLQHEAKIGKFLMRSIMENPIRLIHSSQWYTRGWTYQEGVLSRRRLVFTDQQVYYECSSMCCYEALNLPLLDLHTEDNQAFKPVFTHAINPGMFPRQLGSSPGEVVKHIKDYTTRTLSNPADILDGFLGILRILEEGPYRIRHCMGVPILSHRRGTIHSDIAPDVKIVQGKTISNSWPTTAGFCLGLSWDLILDTPRRRRAGFPSWSWTGWFGWVGWDPSVSTDHYAAQSDMDFKVSVQLKDGRILSWDDFHQSYHELSRQLSSTLHISAWATPLQFRESRDERGNWNIVVDMTYGRRPHEFTCFRPSKKLLPENCWVFILAPCGSNATILVIVSWLFVKPSLREHMSGLDVSGFLKGL